MSKTYEFPPITRENGSEVSEAEARESLKPVPVSFFYLGLKFTAFFDRSKVPTESILKMKSARTRLLRERGGGALVDEAEDIIALAAQIGDMTDAQAEAKVGKDAMQRLRDFTRKAQMDAAEDEPKLFPIKVEMLVPAILAWNVPTETATLDSLGKNGSLAEAVIPALWEAYRFTLTGSSVQEAEPEAEPETEAKTTQSSSESATTSPAPETTENSQTDS